MDSKQMKVAYVITERGDKSYWTRIGVGYVNRDGSINVKLDAMPVGGTLQLRDWTPRDDQQAAPGRRNNGARPQESAAQDDLPDAF